MLMSAFCPVPQELLYSRQDPEDPRLGELVRSDQELVTSTGWTIAGYPDDEGIRLNGGRAGAALAPTEIRRWLYRMTPDCNQAEVPALVDRGDIDVKAYSLNDRHSQVRKEVSRTLKAGGRWLGLGGGHDYGFADVAGFMDAFETDGQPLVINLDAHLDVRPTHKGFHSGTPFRRVLEEFKRVDFVAIGIQNQCNARPHLEWLKNQGGHVWFLEELELTEDQPGAAICNRLMPFLERPRPVFLSIDLDAFSSAYAPGCSQSWPTGLTPNAALTVIDFLAFRSHLMGAGLYEVSPPLDMDGRTARLAAILAHRIISHPTLRR
jgi:formiminoglutamase